MLCRKESLKDIFEDMLLALLSFGVVSALLATKGVPVQASDPISHAL